MESLPDWFWTLYIIFLFLSLITGIVGLVRQWFSTLSAITIALSLLAPLVSFVYSVQRPAGVTELGYLLAQLKTGDLWAIFISVIFIIFNRLESIFINLFYCENDSNPFCQGETN